MVCQQMWIPVALIIVTVLALQARASDVTLSNATFTAFTKSAGNSKILHFRSISGVRTKGACSFHCSNENGCTGFYHDPVAQTCDVGSGLASMHALSSLTKLLPGGAYTLGAGVPTPTIWEADLVGRTYTEAKALCQHQGGKVITPRTMDTVNLLLQLYEDFEFTTGIWFGLDDLAVEGEFRWVDDNSLIDPDHKLQMFQPGEPNDQYGEDCVEMIRRYNGVIRVIDRACTNKRITLCEQI